MVANSKPSTGFFLADQVMLMFGAFAFSPPDNVPCKVTQLLLRSKSFILQPHLWHVEVPELGDESEQQPPAHTTAIATLNPSPILDLCCSLQQHCILNPLSKARDQTSWILCWVLNLLSHSGNSLRGKF